jgi:hypothetical protein
MRVLADIQKDFQQYLLESDADIQADIVSTNKMSSDGRLNIYRHAYYSRLLEMFQLDYPVLHALLGNDEFLQLGHQYIDAHPSQFRSIRWFGDKLAIFLKNVQPYANKPFLEEIARFEWLLTETFDSKDETVMLLEDMANIAADSWPTMHFVHHLSVKQTNFQWNITELWKQVQANQTINLIQHEKPLAYLIWRKGYEVQFCSLSPDEAYMLDAMQAGKNFGNICEGLCEWIDENDIAMHAASLLKRYIIDGIVHQVIY